MLRGMDVVVHAAAYAEEWGTRAQFWEANVDGTQKTLDAARRAGVARFVHIGTEAAVFDGHDLVNIDETREYPAVQKYLYSETKAEASAGCSPRAHRTSLLSPCARASCGGRATIV